MATNQDACADLHAGAGIPNGSPTREVTANSPGMAEDVDIVSLLGNLSDAASGSVQRVGYGFSSLVFMTQHRHINRSGGYHAKH
jgi:hypothetical protein